MLAALMDSCLLLPFIFLLCSLVCVFLLFSQQLLKPRRWWRGQPAGNLFWFWVFVVCRDEGIGRANTRLCVLLLSCSLRLSVYYFFLWIYALFFLCSFLRFLVFCLGLASVLPLPVFVFHPIGSWPVSPSLFSGFFLWVFTWVFAEQEDFCLRFLPWFFAQTPSWFCFILLLVVCVSVFFYCLLYFSSVSIRALPFPVFFLGFFLVSFRFLSNRLLPPFFYYTLISVLKSFRVWEIKF